MPSGIRRGSHLGPEPVKGFIEVKHPAALSNVCRSSLRGRRYSPTLLALLRIVELGPGGGSQVSASEMEKVRSEALGI